MGETTMTAEPGVPQVVMTREFHASPDVLFRAYTEPELISQWWGPRRFATKVDRFDLRHGGEWRFLNIDDDGNEYGFHGLFHGTPTVHGGVVQTWEFEGAPGHVHLETATFEEHDGGTRLVADRLLPVGGVARRGVQRGHGGRRARDARPPRRAGRHAAARLARPRTDAAGFTRRRRQRRRRNDSETAGEDAVALAAVPPVRRESPAMSVRRLAWPLFGLWIALAVAAIVLQTAVGDAFNAAIAPVLAVLAAVGLLLSAAPAREHDRPDPARAGDHDHVLHRRGGDLPAVGRGSRCRRSRVRVLVALDETFGLLWLTAIGVLLPLRLPDRSAALAALAARAVEHRRRGGAGHARHRPGPRTARLGDARQHRQSAARRRHARRRRSVRSRTEARWPSCSSSSPRSRGSAIARAALVAAWSASSSSGFVLALGTALGGLVRGRMWRHVRVGAGRQRRLVGVHGGADRRHAASRSAWRSCATGSTTSTW